MTLASSRRSGMIPDGVSLRDVIALFDPDTASRSQDSRRRDSLFKALLGGGAVLPQSGPRARFWRHEYDHRALCLLQLLLLFNRSNAVRQDHAEHVLQCRRAGRIAELYRELENSAAVAASAVPELVEALTGAILQLFRPAAPGLKLVLRLADLPVAPERKRAVVTLAGMLTMKTLYDAAQRQYAGTLSITSASAPDSIRLLFTMSTDPEEILRSADLEIISGLAAILEANLVFRKTQLPATCIDLEFSPTPGAGAAGRGRVAAARLRARLSN